jgi:hypothetical protein
MEYLWDSRALDSGSEIILADMRAGAGQVAAD